MQAGKMASMGEIAAGMAHELTQPLFGIKGFAEAARKDMMMIESKELAPTYKIKQAENTIKDLEVISEQADRMIILINNVRNFARGASSEKIKLDVNKPVENAAMLLTEQFRLHSIIFKKNLSPDLPQIMGNSSQLQQIFINLISNARDAIDENVNNKKEKQLTINSKLSNDNKFIQVELLDTGIGMDEETKSKIFDPFFTTKATGKGTGLGMSIVSKILEEHKGTIEVISKVGEGTKVTIFFPV